MLIVQMGNYLDWCITSEGAKLNAVNVSGNLRLHLGKLGRDVKPVVIRGCKPMIHIMHLQARLVLIRLW